jgi:hypothetical protein
MIVKTCTWMVGACILYEKMGFVRCPERDFKEDERMQIIAYEKDLS